MENIKAQLKLLNGTTLDCYTKESSTPDPKRNVIIYIARMPDEDHYIIEDATYGNQTTIHKSLISDNHLELKEGYFLAPQSLAHTWFEDFHKARIKKQQKQESLLFINNILNFYAHKDLIYSDSRYFLIPLPDSLTSGMAYLGEIPLTLGMLLELWDTEPATIDSHSDCDGKVLIIYFAGSPLSGSHAWSGICSKCNKRIKGHKEHFPSLWVPVGTYAKLYSNYLHYAHATVQELVEKLANN
ncbi:MAG: hypothetical protein IT292_07180 [Deltaproteobacteria bacterium]|nr:hypothetical protein [Deltaproteobacteria bacterium]